MKCFHDSNLYKHMVDVDNNSFFHTGLNKSPKRSFFNVPLHMTAKVETENDCIAEKIKK